MSDDITITRGKRRDGGPLLFAHADVSDLRVQVGPEWPDAMLDAGIAPGPPLVGGSDPAALDALAARISDTADELRRAIRERWRCAECRDDRWTIHVEGAFGMRQCKGCESIDRSQKQRLPCRAYGGRGKGHKFPLGAQNPSPCPACGGSGKQPTEDTS